MWLTVTKGGAGLSETGAVEPTRRWTRDEARQWLARTDQERRERLDRYVAALEESCWPFSADTRVRLVEPESGQWRLYPAPYWCPDRPAAPRQD